LERYSLSKQVITGATKVSIESHSLRSPSTIDDARTAGSSTKRKYSDSSLCLGFTFTGDEISCEAAYALCSHVLPNNPRYLLNLLDMVMLITLRVRTKILVSSSLCLRINKLSKLYGEMLKI
jgi:hypothetical protein